MFNLAIDSKLRGCDVVALKVEDIAPHGYAIDRATVRQRKTGRPVRFEVTEQTRQAVDDYIRATGKKPGEFLFGGRRGSGSMHDNAAICTSCRRMGQRHRADPGLFGTHSLRRTKATLIYRRTGNLRAVQLLLGHTKIESTVRYLGIEVDDAIAIAEQVDSLALRAEQTALPANVKQAYIVYAIHRDRSSQFERVGNYVCFAPVFGPLSALIGTSEMGHNQT